MIEKYPHKYAVMDDCGYTDADLVIKINEIIDVVNMLLKENDELKRQQVAREAVEDAFAKLEDYEEPDGWLRLKMSSIFQLFELDK